MHEKCSILAYYKTKFFFVTVKPINLQAWYHLRHAFLLRTYTCHKIFCCQCTCLLLVLHCRFPILYFCGHFSITWIIFLVLKAPFTVKFAFTFYHFNYTRFQWQCPLFTLLQWLFQSFFPINRKTRRDYWKPKLPLPVAPSRSGNVWSNKMVKYTKLVSSYFLENH